MTEDEAKTLACCGSPSIAASTYYRAGAQVDAPMHCIASACMAWRWAGYRAADGTWVRKTAEGPWKPENADGFCGLAGAQP